MPFDDIEKAKREVASSDENYNTQKVTDIGYIYLSQQINTMMQMLNEFRNNTDLRFDNQRQEFKSEIKALRDELKGDMSGLRSELKGEMSGLRSELKGDIKGLRSEFGSIKTWFIGSVIAIVGILISIIGLILKL